MWQKPDLWHSTYTISSARFSSYLYIEISKQSSHSTEIHFWDWFMHLVQYKWSIRNIEHLHRHLTQQQTSIDDDEDDRHFHVLWYCSCVFVQPIVSIITIPRYWYIISEWCQLYAWFHHHHHIRSPSTVHSSIVRQRDCSYQRLSHQLHWSCPLTDIERWTISLHHWLIDWIDLHVQWCTLLIDSTDTFSKNISKERDTFIRWK